MSSDAVFRLSVSGDVDKMRSTHHRRKDQIYLDKWYSGKSDGGYLFVLALAQTVEGLDDCVKRAIEAIGTLEGPENVD